MTGSWINGQSHNRTAGALTQLKLTQGRVESPWFHQNGVKVVVILDVISDHAALSRELPFDIETVIPPQPAFEWDRSQSSELRT